ncbi:MAG: cation:proton antiporter [Candidatus Dormibacteria bacterium]
MAVAKLCGDLATRLGQPSVSGALVAGIVLSPGLLDLVGHVQGAPALMAADRGALQTVAGIGVVLLLFLAGLETDLDELVRAGRGAALVAVGGVACTLALVTGAALLGGLALRESFFVSVMLASTSVSISVQALLELRQLQTRVGLTILGAAVTDDVIGLLVFSITLAALGISGVAPVVLVVGLLAYFGISLGVGLPYAGSVLRLMRRLRTTESLLGMSIAFCIFMGWLAQTAGIAAITGAYLAGLILGRSAGAELADRLRIVAYALPVPVFLVNVGMQADLRQVGGGALLLIAVPVATLLSKVLGCGLGAIIEGIRGRGAALVGFGMIPRGEVTLVIAALGVQSHVLSPTGYALGVLAVLVSAVVTPPLLKALLRPGSTGAAVRVA